MQALFCCDASSGSGSAKWRAVIPAKYLARRGHTIHLLRKGVNPATKPDAVVFCRFYRIEAVPRLFLWCKERRVRTIYDLDDNPDCMDASNPTSAEVSRFLPQIHMFLEHADLVTTTTPQLAEQLRKQNRNVAVIPNSVDPEEWTARPRPPVAGRPPRIGWTGGNSHFLDLCEATESLADLQKQRNFTLVIHGLTTNASVEDLYRLWELRHGATDPASALGRAIRTFLAASRSLQYEFHPIVPVLAHAAKTCDLLLDLGIAPLVDSAFNRNKSCIKYYEYAMSGAATLASDVLPYSAEVPLRTRNSRKAWTERLAELMDSDLTALAARQREWVLANRNIEQTVALWEQALRG